eukprot:m51a1_g9299 hypothetical protein (402) ;mRNA; r:58504-60050
MCNLDETIDLTQTDDPDPDTPPPSVPAIPDPDADVSLIDLTQPEDDDAGGTPEAPPLSPPLVAPVDDTAQPQADPVEEYSPPPKEKKRRVDGRPEPPAGAGVRRAGTRERWDALSLAARGALVVLLDDPPCTCLRPMLESCGMPVRSFKSPARGAIAWRRVRKASAALLSTHTASPIPPSDLEDAPFVVLYATADEFVDALMRDERGVDALLRPACEAWPNARLSLVVEGATPSSLRSRLQRGRSAATLESHVQPALVRAESEFSCSVVWTRDAAESASYVASVTRAVAEEPFRRRDPTRFCSQAARPSRALAGLADVWAAMLAQVPGMSERSAKGVTKFYPTVDSLMRAYSDPALTESQRGLLLADIAVPYGGGTRPLGHALSRKVYKALFSPNPLEPLY